jgi:hypothetical protein
MNAVSLTEFVLAQRDDGAPGPAVADASQREVHQCEHDQRVHVEACGGRHVDPAEQGKPLDPLLRDPAEELAVQQPRVDREREHQGGDGEVEPAQTQRREPDDERGDRSGDASEHQRQRHVDAPGDRRLATHRCTDRDERHLAEGDLSRPARQHDQ